MLEFIFDAPRGAQIWKINKGKAWNLIANFIVNLGS
jgi:hypothetical protein